MSDLTDDPLEVWFPGLLLLLGFLLLLFWFLFRFFLLLSGCIVGVKQADYFILKLSSSVNSGLLALVFLILARFLLPVLVVSLVPPVSSTALGADIRLHGFLLVVALLVPTAVSVSIATSVVSSVAVVFSIATLLCLLTLLHFLHLLFLDLLLGLELSILAAVWPALCLTLESVFDHELDSVGWAVFAALRSFCHGHYFFKAIKNLVIVFLRDFLRFFLFLSNLFDLFLD